MAHSGAGSSSDPARATGAEYEVFLSFRDLDTRHGFTVNFTNFDLAAFLDHTRHEFPDSLYHGLVDAGVSVFRDDEELRAGEVIGRRLQHAIDNSLLYIPIFSRTYASSKWCLRKLAHIVDAVSKSQGQKDIIPIYFDVEPEDVKLKTPLYSDALLEHAKKFPDEVEAWRAALKEVDESKGWNLKMNQSYDNVELVVREVWEKLIIKQKLVTEHFIGLDDQIKDLTELLHVDHPDVRVIGIYGMGGIGKTTVAKVIFNQLFPHFEKCSFLEGIRERSTKEGIVLLQKELLSNIGGYRHAERINDSEEGMTMIGETLRNKKVLLVLDDVDEKESIKNLLANSKLHQGSRIIITTRNRAILQVEGFEVKVYLYEMQTMNSGLALQLFCRHAFREDYHTDDYHKLSREIVSCTGGLPLAIEVIGSFLFGKDREFWQETLDKLRKVSEENIAKKLRMSYDSLDKYQKQIFLDIACFFLNGNITDAIYMWDSCPFYPLRGIRDLTKRGLMKVLDDGKLWMHDELKSLGREIVREESPEDLGKQSRLWIAEEALAIIRTEERKDKVQALEIDGLDDSIEITDEELERLPNLRFLKLGNGTFAGDFAKCRSQLIWISWCSPHQDFRANNMYLDHLVVFKLDKSGFTDDSKAWDLIKSARNLKVLSLTECKGITTIPDFSRCLCLKKLTLARCDRLKRIESFIGDLRSLIELEIEGCEDLIDLPEEIGALVNLKRFSLSGCIRLRELPGSIQNLTSLTELDLSDTIIRELPYSIGKLKSLRISHPPVKSRVARIEEWEVESRPSSTVSDMGTSDIGYTFASVQNVVGFDDREEEITYLLETEVSDERMQIMEDDAGPPPSDMETSDRNYAIAAVQNVVGIDDRAKQITDLLEMEVDDEVRIIGIHGTDGIGKTTLAKAVYDLISSCFDSRSFLAEVEETAQDATGIQVLQTKLIRDIVERDHGDPSFDERIEDFLDIFRERKVLIVVNDVKEQSHLHAIVGEQLHWFGPGSRIIVTSENKEILNEYDPEKARTYTVGALDDGKAFELFCEHAFRMQSSIPDYDGLANRIVNTTGKLPLAVEVVGSFLRGKSIQEWAKMEKSMKERTRSSGKTTVGPKEILDICYRELDQKQKDIFLDMACFISGVDARIASHMWPSSYRPSSGCVLMPLAKIGENNELQMHRLPRCLGKRILKQEESQNPRSRRFCTQKAMNRETGTANVEALCFDFTAGDFRRMPKIRFLKLDNARVSGNFAGAFASLRWLCWQRCPPDFSAENLVLGELVILDLSWSKVTEDWGGWRKIKMPKLKVLNLTGCSDLLFTPDFSGYQDLEILILEGCSRLVKLDPSIGHLKRLVSLNLKSCSRLNSLPVEMGGTTALKELFIDRTSIREIPISIGNLKKLEILSGFECFPITHLPRSICYMTALSELSFDGAKITKLPSLLGNLLKLRRLSLRNCRHLEELPDSFDRRASLEELDISGTRISVLPGSIGNLESLKVLRMDYSFIRAFPGEIGNLTNLEELHASWCRSLKGAIPGNIKGLRRLRSLTLGHSRISSPPLEISTIPGLRTLDLLQCNEIEELPKLPPSLIRLRVSSTRMKVMPLLDDLKELEELCLSDGDPMERRPPSKQPMLESNVIDEQSFSISLPKLRKLELSLSQVIKLKFGPTDIPPLKRLKMLTHAGSSRKEVSELPKVLSALKLYDFAIEEIEGLEGLEALKRLEISNCSIRNLDGIGQLTSLRSLILSDCDCFSSLDLSKLESLKVLEIRRCKKICQIEGLEKLTSLEKLNISECPAENSVQVQNALKHVMARSTVT